MKIYLSDGHNQFLLTAERGSPRMDHSGESMVALPLWALLFRAFVQLPLCSVNRR